MNKDIKKTISSKTKPEKYFEGIGRRKTAVARVRIFNGDGKFIVNGKKIMDYFKLERLLKIAQSPLNNLNIKNKLDISVKIKGSGISAQAEAIRHGLSRALVKFDSKLKKELKRAGFLTRDSRMVERKKYGLKKARRAPQWSKR
jgi:small subunit ribosomal protein S9